MQDTDHQEINRNSIEEGATNSRRLARNTIMLYFRMFVMILIGLYTSRVVLQVLGVTDYGIYYAVGGLVTMFLIVTRTLSTAISRYMTFELGRGDTERLNAIFSMSVNIQTMIAAFVVIVGSAVGWWFLNYQMVIPPERLPAANWVLFCSILTFAIGLINVPYNATIVSHEKMDIFAYMSILDAVLKLLIVFALYVSPWDKLKTYAVLLLCVSLFTRAIYMFYCKTHFRECKYRFTRDTALLKEMTSFAGWNFLGNAAWILNTQGINVLINLFFGVALNAARGVAVQVEGLVLQFVNSFMTALNPQITKSYASGDLPQMHQLVCRGAKFSFFLTMLFAIPFCLETEKILSIWLGVVPGYAVNFVRLSFVSCICTVLSNTLVTAQFATGKIKKYQIVITLCGGWVFPLTWLAYKLGGAPIWAYYVFCLIYFILIFVRIYLVKDMIQLSWVYYVKEVLLRSGAVLAVAVILPLAVYFLMPPSLMRLITICLVSLVSSALVIYLIGLQPGERQSIKRLLARYLHRGKATA